MHIGLDDHLIKWWSLSLCPTVLVEKGEIALGV